MSLFKRLFQGSRGETPEPGPTAEEIFARLDAALRKASIAQIGGFRPPEDPVTSWFGGRAVARPEEGVPESGGDPMFPLLQVNCSELPYVPGELAGTALFVVWLDPAAIPFDRPHGDGWRIREYPSLDGLEPVEGFAAPEYLRAFPIRWSLSEDDAPGWTDAWGVAGLKAFDASKMDLDEFHRRYSNHWGTKVGGYPSEIQHGIGGDAPFVFQIGSEEKARWMWADNGIGYFQKTPAGEWFFQCQFY